jgi:hypothetical protein
MHRQTQQEGWQLDIEPIAKPGGQPGEPLLKLLHQVAEHGFTLLNVACPCLPERLLQFSTAERMYYPFSIPPNLPTVTARLPTSCDDSTRGIRSRCGTLAWPGHFYVAHLHLGVVLPSIAIVESPPLWQKFHDGSLRLTHIGTAPAAKLP